MDKLFQMKKDLKSYQRRNLVFKIATMLVLVALLTTGVVFASYSDDVNQGLADNLIRLHVIANSDTKEDQDLKRDVRDVILNYMKVQLKDSKDIDQTKYIINKDMQKIRQRAIEEITRHNKTYSVKTTLGAYPFPTKAYGDITLPAGTYEALRVVIGKGEGANWWCVLFPPLCFVDATHGTVPDSVKSDLRSALTNEEYSIITSADSEEDIPIKVKFKIVEIFQNTKIKLSNLIKNIFK